MCLHPWYPASIWRAGTELFIFDSLARLSSRALHVMASAGRRHLSSWSTHHPLALCSSAQLVFGKPPRSPQLVYEIKGDSVSSSRTGNGPWLGQSQQSIWHCAQIGDVPRTQAWRIMGSPLQRQGTTGNFLLGCETMRLQIWAHQQPVGTMQGDPA